MPGLLGRLLELATGRGPNPPGPGRAAPDPTAADSEISPVRLDEALRRLRDEHPGPESGSQGTPES